MIYSIGCSFTDEANLQIQKLWKQLKAEGICNFMIDTYAHPHISLAVYHSIDWQELHSCLQQFVSQQNSFGLNLLEIGSFVGEESVMYIAPRNSKELVSFHRQLHEKIQSLLSYQQMWTFYQPKAWKAHCTMGIHLSEKKLKEALDFMHKHFTPIFTSIQKIVLVEYDEKMYGRVCETYQLKDNKVNNM